MEANIAEAHASDRTRFERLEKDMAAMKMAHDSDKKEMEANIALMQKIISGLEKKLDQLSNTKPSSGSEPPLKPSPGTKLPGHNDDDPVHIPDIM